MDILSLPFISPKVSSPASLENEMSLNLSHHYQTKFHSPVYRITEYQTSFIPRFIGLRNIKQGSFPGLSDYGISNKCLSPVCRITEGHSSSIFLIVSSPSISDNEASLNFNFLKKIVIYRCHPPACLVKGCH